jgi:hypothetical protein
MPTSPKIFVQRIRASINRYFDSQKGPYTLFIEGTIPKIPAVDAWAELRINGPSFSQPLQTEWHVDVGIDIMCSAKQTTDLYLVDKVVGQFLEAMVQIPVYIEGNELWYCLQRQERVQTIPWGIVKGNLNTYSTSVMADYKGDFRYVGN